VRRAVDQQRDAEVARQAERPHHADEHDGERQQPPADVEQQQEDGGHDRHGDGAERQHAAAQVVVEVLE
jgi:hypothetical protein